MTSHDAHEPHEPGEPRRCTDGERETRTTSSSAVRRCSSAATSRRPRSSSSGPTGRSRARARSSRRWDGRTSTRARRERAHATFEALLEIEPSSHYAHYALGQSLKRLGRTRPRRGPTCASRWRSARTTPLYRGALARLGRPKDDRACPTVRALSTRLARAPARAGRRVVLASANPAALGGRDGLAPRHPLEQRGARPRRVRGRSPSAGREVRGEIQVHELGGEAGRRVERARLAATTPARIPVSSSSSRRRGEVRVLDRPVRRRCRASRPGSRAGLARRRPGTGGRAAPGPRRRCARIATAPGMADDVARAARAVGALDGVDAERQVAALMEDPRVDDALDEIGPGGILRGRRVAVRRVGRSGDDRRRPGRGSGRSRRRRGGACRAAGRGRRCRRARTRCDESTIATMSWSAALTWSSSSLPRYSTTSARARNEPAAAPASPMSRCSGRKPATSVLPASRRRRLAVARRERDRPVGRADQPARCRRRPRSWTSTKFIDGLPMKPATNLLIGVVVQLLRRADLLEEAVVHDRDPVPIVIASTWSWVT